MSDVHLHNGLRYSVNSEGRCDWYNCTHNVYNSFDAPEVDYEATRDANDDDSGPTYREMLDRMTENMDREYIDSMRKRIDEDIEKAKLLDASREQALSMIGKVWAGNAGPELFQLMNNGRYVDAYVMAKAKVDKQDEELLAREAEAGYNVEELRPRVGMRVSYHGEGDYRIVEIDKYDDDPGWIKLDNGWEVDFYHCCELLANGPCPVCGEVAGFHNDDMHRKDIDPKYLKEKGWHLK